MLRFTALLATPPTAATIHAALPPQDAHAAIALLQGHRPKRIATPDTLLAWVAEATQTPAFLVEACLATSDRSEVAALLLPDPQGTPPTLSEVLSTLTPATYLGLALRLPVASRLILNRLATGTFRSKLATPITKATPGTCLAILTLIDPSGPMVSLALRHGNGLIPLTKAPLTLPETAQILAWSRAHTTERFGPLRQVAPDLVFALRFSGLTPNPRRKCGFELAQAELTAWRRDLTPDQADTIAHLIASATGPADTTA